MSEKEKKSNPWDPTGMFTEMRNAHLENWAKAMVDLVNTQAYAEATGAALDAWLSSSAPLRKLLESTQLQVLASLNLPSRDDLTRLAERLTNIELRLDDLEAKLDTLQPPACVSSPGSSAEGPAHAGN